MIELVTVMVIIGVLSAAAIPKFANLKDKAHSAANQHATHSLQSAVQIAHVAWIAAGSSGSTNTVTVDGAAITLNGRGWPAPSGTTTPTVSNCVSLVSAVNNFPETVSSADSCTTPTCYVASAASSACIYTLNGAANNHYFIYDVMRGEVLGGESLVAAAAAANCPTGQTYQGSTLGCQCPAATPVYWSDSIGCGPSCTTGKSWNGSSCACAAGTYANGGNCSNCVAGQSSNVGGSCFSCPAGTYNATPGGLCTNCSAGTSQWQQGKSFCTTCPAGLYSTTDRTSCQNCPGGTYSPAGTGPGIGACTPCAAGTANWQAAQSSCPACSVGLYASGTGNTSCTNCPPGTISTSPGASSCTLCPAGTSQWQQGKSFCTTCAAGLYSTTDAQSCQNCPGGTYSPAGTGPGIGSCIPCPAGTANWQAAQSSCPTCGVNTYSTGGATSCTHCPGGQTSLAGSTSSSACH